MKEENTENNCLALFDFDGTITYKDTFIEIIKYQKGVFDFFIGFLILSPILLLYKLKIILNWRAKEMVLSYFFKDMDVEEFGKKCESFTNEVLPKLIRPDALIQIQEHLRKEHRVIIVSASADLWLKYWCFQNNVELISSKLENKDGKITGKLLGKNCYGQEKVNRIKEIINLQYYKYIYAYGDSKGDKQMLSIATNSFYKFFK
ncbi:HAD-IB family hydrolase [Chondrinema litorale]|uniref:HAD-IB family hydrolase n=1 Tax=Chondrinema litorale TaxID=2994555 RepID=UPI002543B6A9|nr:HAD-IB family hydrolase [Chondrinema litorale]UZS00102.1 HAD-IB family hydrolase [Chondrinema litorale]